MLSHDPVILYSWPVSPCSSPWLAEILEDSCTAPLYSTAQESALGRRFLIFSDCDFQRSSRDVCGTCSGGLWAGVLWLLAS